MATQAASSGGILADFAKRPPGYKAAVFAVIAVALGAAYYMLAYKGQADDLKAAENEKNALVAEGQKLKKDEAEYKSLKEQQERLKQTIADNADALPTAAELPAFFDLLNRKFAEAGVEVKSWNQEREIPVTGTGGDDPAAAPAAGAEGSENYFKVPVTIEVQATFFELKRFFYLLYKMSQKEGDVKTAEPAPTPTPAPADGAKPVAPPIAPSEDRDRIVTIEELEISEPTVVNGELVLTAKFRASTFRQETTPAQADAAKAATGAAKAPAKNLPQKAGEKVEKAIDKGMERNEGAAGASGEPLGGTGAGTASGTGTDRVKGGM